MNTPAALKARIKQSSLSCDSPSLTIPASPFLQRLGYGTGVSVYLVERSPCNGAHRSPWAIKKINRSENKRGSETYSKRLKEEAGILRGLKHDNIVGFRALTKARDGMMCLALEDAEKCLFSMIEDRMESDLGPFPSQNIMKVALDVASALTYLHEEKKLLHGDIKSGNILIKGDFNIAKVCDFGVTVKLDENLAAPSHLYVGTEAWSSKEALQGDTVTNKSDIYSYGLVIYEMLALNIPHFDTFPNEEDFASEQEFEAAFEEAENQYQALLGSRPLLTNAEFGKPYQNSIELFYACTEEDPAKRPSAAQIVHSANECDMVKCRLNF